MSPIASDLLTGIGWFLVFMGMSALISLEEYLHRKNNPYACKQPRVPHTTCFGPGTRCM